MNVTLINTADAGGGAPAACMRLAKALAAGGANVTLLVQQKKTTVPQVVEAVSTTKAKINFLAERLPFIFFYEKDKSVRFAFSTANSGSDISKHPAVAAADVLHLHWTNGGFLSLKNLKQLAALGKPVVWTLHDMWAFTGGCHYSGSCDHFLNQCGNCWMLRRPHADDLSHRGWQRKAALFSATQKFTAVACSNWLAGVAQLSALLKNKQVTSIPNPIDTEIFCARNSAAAREKWGISADAKVILFGAANINDRRKGITYLVEALHLLKQEYPAGSNAEIVIFGKNKHFDVSTLPFKATALNVISSEAALAEIYSLADVFVSPSVEDNLPNMVMESLACATPVVAFNAGGIPDMVKHLHNGYLAQYKSATDLAAGLKYVLFNADTSALKVNARNKVLGNFTPALVAQRYIQLYKSMLS